MEDGSASGGCRAATSSIPEGGTRSPEMEKRIFLAVLLSIAVLGLWALVAPKLFPDLMKPAPQAVAEKPAGPQKAPAAPVPARSAGAAIPPATPHVVAPQPVSARSLVLTKIDAPNFIATFSNRGAQLISFRLKHYKMPDGSLVELVKARDPSRTDFPFALEASNAAMTERLDSALYALQDHMENGQRVLEYRYAGADGVSATKTFRLTQEYLFSFAVAVTPVVPYRVIIGPGIRTLAPDEAESRFTITGNGVVQQQGSLKIITREKSPELAVYDSVDFVGVEDNYFLSVLRPEKSGPALLRAVDFGNGKNKRREIYAALNSTPDGTVSGSAFFGPKETGLLDRYGMEKTLQLGMFGVIARFFLIVLNWINRGTHNYGFAIIVLTILIKVILYPLQHKQMMSMKKMQKLQPKMESIKARYRKHKGDPEQRQKMNQEVMKLYQQEGVNPAGGCLPLLIQLPIFWGFYDLLERAIELRGAPFILWIHDLSAKDPTYILPILMTIAMFVQQWITPTTVDPQQRRMFLIMPIVFGWIFKEFPSGLTLYWLVQNILTIIQQMIMNKYYKDHPAELKSA